MSARQPSSMWVRLVAILAVLVAFDAVLVAAAYWLAHLGVGLVFVMMGGFIVESLTGMTPLELIVGSLTLQAFPSLPVLVAGTVLTLSLQSVFGYRQSLDSAATEPVELNWAFIRSFLTGGNDHSSQQATGTDNASEHVRRHVRDRLTGLAHLSTVSLPSVRVVESPTPNSFVAGRPGEQTLVVTTALVERLDDEQLDAVLAHELAHLKNGDAFVMTAAGFLPTLTARVIERTIRFLRRSKVVTALFPVEPPADEETVFSSAQFHIAAILLSPFVLTVASLLFLTSTACYRALSRIREFRADSGAVAIHGSPAALASALESLSGHERPTADLRTAETGVRELCVLPYSIHDDEDGVDGDGLLARYQRWWQSISATVLPSSHPPVDVRIDALRDRERRAGRN
ncbi:peptidase M48 Ste24p [Halobacteriales archaeon QS_4_62_28]|nr:MAG: peptidase M48 Ste24p [Halobacteriales archaeon QS_4_62_28]